jgi:hypothetical protein
MPANHYVDNDARLIITTWNGDAIDNDLIEALKKYQVEIQNTPDYLDYNEIVNLSNITRVRVSPKGLKNIGEVASSTDENRGKTRLAFVVASDLVFNLARLYATYRNFGKSNIKKIRVFKSEGDARAWLKETDVNGDK